MPAVVDLEKCDVLSIEGERKAEGEIKDEDYYCCERAYGRFYRAILLPAGVKKDKIESEYKEGILKRKQLLITTRIRRYSEMAILSEEVRQKVEDSLKGLKGWLKLVVFTQEFECRSCGDNRMLMEELSAISDKVDIEVLDFVGDKEKGKYYKVDKIPATVVEGKEDYGIRFYGIPGGYEFASLIHAIKMVSSKSSALSTEAKEQLKTLSKPVHIQVFVTLTCPYCPTAVQMAHEMAMESPLITSDMVEATEFPYLNHKYNVAAVPKVVINETIDFEGAVPESDFLKHVMRAGR